MVQLKHMEAKGATLTDDWTTMYQHEVIKKYTDERVKLGASEKETKALLEDFQDEYFEAEKAPNCWSCGEVIEKGKGALDEDANEWHAECLANSRFDPRDDSGYWAEAD